MATTDNDRAQRWAKVKTRWWRRRRLRGTCPYRGSRTTTYRGSRTRPEVTHGGQAEDARGPAKEVVVSLSSQGRVAFVLRTHGGQPRRTGRGGVCGAKDAHNRFASKEGARTREDARGRAGTHEDVLRTYEVVRVVKVSRVSLSPSGNNLGNSQAEGISLNFPLSRQRQFPERREKERSLYSMEFIPLWATVATPDERGVPYSMTLTTYEH